MKICEIFTSIQGESTYAGLPCTFVRLSGCNLRCRYCDTKYSYYEGVEMSAEDIIGHVRAAGVPLVEITGGEPLLQQQDALLLVRDLLNEGYEVLVETNGSLSICEIDKRAVIILDVKTPGSGMSNQMDFSNFDCLKPSDEVKFVVCDRSDYDWAKDVVAELRLKEKAKVLFSPAVGTIQPAELARWIINDKLDVRFNLQIHKYIFGPEERGV
ncbi:MAG TPA: radical SAM protein [Candidatus Sulfobium mesophilum]|nr:radical SAM protein [Candidatus Sulfobium mesophilum]